MDFAVAGSDSWETTAAQEEFIHNYFQEQKIPTTSNKTLKKKRKSVQDLDDLHHQMKQKRSKNKKIFKKIIEINDTEDSKKNSENSIHESDEKELVSKTVNSKKKKVKHGLKKARELSEDLKQNSEDSIHESNGKELVSKTINSKKKKVKHGLKKARELSEDLKQNSEDSFHESDEELVLDIKNSEVFKEIQELMKQSPSLSNLKGCSDESSEEDLNDSSSSGEPSEDDVSSSEAVSAAKITNQTRNVSGNTNSSSEQENCNSNERGEDRGSLKERTKATLLVQNAKNKTAASTALKNKAREKLQAAKFRYLNEKLYTETGKSAFQYFQENVEEFHDYHKGYSLQVAKWPMNPVTKIISELQKLSKKTVIADMGCGDAKIARTLTKATVHSFDIVALNEYVRACDISKVPLANESVDVVVFCLSLMGINLKEYLVEAHRILKMGGTLKIAEVESRIDDINVFVRCLKCLGFSLQKQDLKHKIFVFLDLKKVKKGLKNAKIPSLTLRPCLYKKR